jgi:sialate O-acetylesterase
MKDVKRSIWAIIISLAVMTASLEAVVKLPAVLGSHMVLQREMPVPIWGTAAEGENVTVTFRDQVKSTVADAKGKWRVDLDALQAGGPDTLTVKGSNELILEDVLVGEVWLGAGQSNMALPASPALVAGDAGLSKALAGAPYPRLRILTGGAHGKPFGWQVASQTTIPEFSALMFSFGLPLQQKLNVPVGLLVGAIGGTASGCWVSQEGYTNDAACKETIARFAATYSFEDSQRSYEKELTQFKEKESAREKTQPGSRKGKAPIRALRPGESFTTIGNLFEKHIRPFIPFAIRGVLWDQGESGTAVLGVDQYTLMGALIRSWRQEWRQEWGQGEFPFLYMQKPSGGGCAWDPADPVTCKADAFAPLPQSVPADDNWRMDPSLRSNRRHREDFLMMRRYPRTTLVTTMDLGGGTHPLNKSGYGVRACRTALGAVYGGTDEIYGPTYQSHKIEGNMVTVRFAHIGQGLVFKPDDRLQGFAIAGADKKFVWADAVIQSPSGSGGVTDTIVVSSGKVPQPLAVRYAWANWHPWANLFNGEGLPALPFRTDDWESPLISTNGSPATEVE